MLEEFLVGIVLAAGSVAWFRGDTRIDLYHVIQLHGSILAWRDWAERHMGHKVLRAVTPETIAKSAIPGQQSTAREMQ